MIVAFFCDYPSLLFVASLHTPAVSNGVHAFFVEAWGTAVLVFVMFTVTHLKSPVPGVAIPPIIGGTFWLLVSTLGPLTGYVHVVVVSKMHHNLAHSWCFDFYLYMFVDLFSFCYRSASLNPARELGPRIVTFLARWKWQALQECIPYLVGPLVGGPIGAFIADHVLML
jgi:glycerol uptake facilitator protein